MRNTSVDPRGVWAAYAKAARENAGLTQSELARRLSTDRTTVWRWENGRQRIENPDMVAEFARVTGVDLEEAAAAAGLRPGTEPPTEPTRERDEERELILSSSASPRRKALMLQRLEELRERDKQRRMEDIRYLLEQGN